ncbi:MAG: ATP-binding cassette domain-containing protein [Spirochaetaceae bacterium]|nr:MAG: ATP-binding cassette domain-containing protein [Spirochaetaceae bacterium]
MKNINFYYDSLRVLKDINLTIHESEVHAIVGEHGAGKTSLCMIICGFLKPHSGSFVFNDRELDSWSQRRAMNRGIELVSQQNPLVENFTVAENIFLDNRGLSTHPFVSRKNNLEQAALFCKKHDFPVNPSAFIKNLKLSDRVLVDILKHLYKQPKLLILDEALQKLTAPNLNRMIQILKELKREGMSIIFVTHRIDDIYTFADKVSIIKNGEILITDSVRNIDKINLIKLAYTQISNTSAVENANKEFYNLLKYNEAVLKNLPVNLIVVDRDGSIKLINEYARQYFGIDESTYLNMPVKKLLAKGNTDAYRLIAKGLANQNGDNFYNIPVSHNSTESITNIKIHPIYDETFRIGDYIIIEDVTEREKLREQVIVSEKLASIGLLSAGVAHEINNPLEIIYNYIRYLKFNSSDSEVAHTVNNLEEEIQSITQIVSNLISFSDSSRNQMERVNLNELITSIIRLVRHNAEYKSIDICFQTNEEPIYFRINKTEIKQVILNLMKNSFEAMPDGGKLIVKVADKKTGESPYVEIKFQDTGCGIKKRNIHDVFLPFYSTKKEKFGNLGLGLSVSYGIVKKYNGTITVGNLSGSGCEFIIRIPRHPSEE